MALDINKVRSRLNQLQSKGKKNADGTFEKTDFTKIFWKPKEGKQTIRIVPAKSNPGYPFLDVSYHNNIVKKKYLTLTNFGEKDPIVEFANELKSSKDKEEKDFGWKMSPKTRTYAQVLVRGEEHLGVRLWEFSSKVLKQLLSILENIDEYGDITDVNDGRDLGVEGVAASFGDIKYVEVTVLPKGKPSVLAETEAEINKYLEEQHDPLNLPFNKRYTYNEIKEFLREWLNPEGAEENTEASAEVEKEEVKDDLDVVMSEVEDNGEESSDDLVEDAVLVEDEPPFVPDPPKADAKKSAIANASKRIVAKNNAEIAAKATGIPKSQVATVKAPAKVATPAATVTAPKAVVPAGSNKKKFEDLFGKK